MEIFVDNNRVPPKDVGFSELGFGMNLASALSKYELRIPIYEFKARFATEYETCVNELKSDDSITGESHIYLSLDDLIGDEGEAFYEFVYTFLKFKIFDVYFTWVSANPPPIRLATVDAVSVNQNEVTIQGRANCSGELW